MGDAAGQWCLIESDPGVFTELVRQFGCTGVQIEELYSLDETAFAELRPVQGLIFLFKWVAGQEPSGSLVKDDRLKDIFFAQQVIQNACATQAIVNLLLNTEDPNVHLGPILNEFKNFTAAFDPANRGLCLSNSDQIRKVHNSFARQTLFDIDVQGMIHIWRHGFRTEIFPGGLGHMGSIPQVPEKEDVYHFITYLPIKGRVYELDGLQEAPMDVGKVGEGKDWIEVVRPIIEEKIKKYSEGEIHFNLMAVISDRKMKYQKRLQELAESAMDTDAAAEEVYKLQTLIAEEDHKYETFKAENMRRKHNYIPFIMELLKILAKEGKLAPMVKEAKEKAVKKAEEEKATKEKEGKEKKADPVVSEGETPAKKT